MSPLPEAERFARLQLARTDRIGPVAFDQLIQRFGSAVRAIEALPDLIRRGGGAEAYRVVALTGARNVARLAEMARELRAEVAVVAHSSSIRQQFLMVTAAGSG